VKVIKAIYNFFVGDMIILIGVAIAVILLALINTVSAFAPLRGVVSAIILIAAVLISLTATLIREVRG
jgi:uncharacterized Tic20 family protein